MKKEFHPGARDQFSSSCDSDHSYLEPLDTKVTAKDVITEVCLFGLLILGIFTMVSA